ncbi:hemolysin III family protein [Paenalkalicoccus suaedae]|uniref:Hemolysin III family protein n=1 Tax=Paenalkalicoccus suaedae TaxID=2592382 RepID=A0A859FBL2_9BACI|nr:hemolysin III family protein [Paenalkalicoccus suaedae]QKS70091.1 hemolysin III family protein [Paenalkalicoccus suaedae]
MSTHMFSKEEEILNSAIHGVGVLFSIVAVILLPIYAAAQGTTWHVVSFTIFAVSMLLLYLSSTLLHALPQGRSKDVLEVMDHASIYFFIAGTYTPFLFIAVQGWLGWTLFGIVWGFAIIGTILKCFFVKKYMFISTIGYIVLGWQIVFAWNAISAVLPPSGITYLVAGGILYTFGAIFYMWRGFKYHHAVWHLFVLAGTVTHFIAVLSLLSVQ